jgi:hypothetical protein
VLSHEGEPALSAWSRRDHASLPAVALGPKAALLQARRLRTRAPDHAPHLALGSGINLRTADGLLSYSANAVGSALFLERIQRRPLGTVLTQDLVFCSLAEFEQWCEAEPLRFEDPQLFQRLHRFGEGCFDARR